MNDLGHTAIPLVCVHGVDTENFITLLIFVIKVASDFIFFLMEAQGVPCEVETGSVCACHAD
jgi:hypothetical protein